MKKMKYIPVFSESILELGKVELAISIEIMSFEDSPQIEESVALLCRLLSDDWLELKVNLFNSNGGVHAEVSHFQKD